MAWRCRATSTQWRSARHGRASNHARNMCSIRWGGARDTSSTWGMASCRRRRSRMYGDWWSLYMSIRRAAMLQVEPGASRASAEEGAHVVIVGGGIAGLSAAWYLQQEATRH